LSQFELLKQYKHIIYVHHNHKQVTHANYIQFITQSLRNTNTRVITQTLSDIIYMLQYFAPVECLCLPFKLSSHIFLTFYLSINPLLSCLLLGE